MKKIIALLLALAVVFSFCACAKAPTNQQNEPAGNNNQAEVIDNTGKNEKKTLVVWLPPNSSNNDDQQVWDGIFDKFEEENNVTVKVEIIPWGNYEEKYLTAITAGEGPDVGYMYMEMIYDFVNMGALAALDEFITDADRDNYIYLSNGVIEGEQYCMPFIVGGTRVLCANMDILAANGITEIPENWDDFVDVCKKITVAADGSSDVFPFLQEWGNDTIGTLNTCFYPYLWQAGGDIYNAEGTKMVIDSEAGRKAVQFIYDLRFTHNILPELTTSLNSDAVRNYLIEGKTAFAVISAKDTAQLDEAGLNWKYITSLADAEKGTFVSSDSLVMLSSAEDKELTWKCIQYMLSGEVMTKFHESASFPPIAKDEEYHDNPLFVEMYANDSEYMHTLPAVKNSASIMENLYRNLQSMMIGEMTPEEVVTQSVEYADKVLNE